MSRFTIADLPIAGLKSVTRAPLADARGFFARLFCAEELEAAGWAGAVAQINHSCTMRAGSIRGMHFQKPPHGEIKLVSCIRGAVWDVAVDIRAGSPTFLHWHGETLSASNGRALLIPAGFAHGFQTLTGEAELLYCHSAAYAPDAEGALNAFDPRLAIDWPEPIGDISDRDRGHPFLTTDFQGIAS